MRFILNFHSTHKYNKKIIMDETLFKSVRITNVRFINQVYETAENYKIHYEPRECLAG